MAKQRYLNTQIWRDCYFSEMEMAEKLLFIYLLTNPDTNISGIYQLPLKIISVDTGLSLEKLKKMFISLEKDSKVKYQNGWVAMKNFTIHQSINPKIKIGIECELEKAPQNLAGWVNLNSKVEYDIEKHSLSNQESIAYDSLSHFNSNSNSNSNINSNGDGNSQIAKKEPTPSKPKSFKLLTEQEFYECLLGFKKSYGQKTIEDFFDYWTEPTAGGKMRFQTQQTWCVERRLKRWAKSDNDKIKTKPSRNNNYPKSKSEKVDDALDGFLNPQSEEKEIKIEVV